MAKPKTRVRMPETAAPGELIQIKTLIGHRMESGHRKDKLGNPIPREIVNGFTCAFNGRTVFSCDLGTAVSANPYFAFTARVTESGRFTFTWVDDNGEVYSEERHIEVA